MKPFYSIVYVPIRPEAKELLSVGLFMRGDKEVYFEYSKHKLNVLKELLPKQAYNLLKLTLNSIVNTVENALGEFNASQLGLLPATDIENSILQEPYINYLSRYSKNLVAFSAPQYIDIAINREVYQLFFKKLVDEFHFDHKHEEKSRDIVLYTRSVLKPRIEKRVNWDFKITKSHIPNLILPNVHVDFVGKNDIYVTGEAVNFEKREYDLEYSIARQIALIDAMRSENGGSQCFILGKEPNKTIFKNQHKLWRNVYDSKEIEFVDTDEHERVANYMELHDVKPIV